MPKIQNVIYFLPNNRKKNYFYIELTRLNMDDFFTLEEKKGAFFTLSTFIAVCRRQYFLERLPKVKETSYQGGPM